MENKVQTEINKTNIENIQQNIITMQKYAVNMVRLAWALMVVIGLLAVWLVKLEINYDNTNDAFQQNEINSLDARIYRLEVGNGSKDFK